MKRQCRCSVRQIEKCGQRMSGILLNCIGTGIEVPLVDFKELTSDALTGESSSVIHGEPRRCLRNPDRPFKFRKKLTINAAKQMRECCQLDAESKGNLEHAI